MEQSGAGRATGGAGGQRISFVLAVVSIVLVSPIVGHAQELYVRVESGASFVQSSDLDGGGLSGEAKFDPGFEVGFAGGIRFVDHVRAEIALSYREAEVDEVTAPGVTLDGRGQVGTFATFLNAYYDVLPGAPVVPFVGVGLGFAVIRVDSDPGANVLVVDDTATEFAWNVLAGAEVPLGDHVALSIAYRYLGTTDPEFDATLVGVGSASLEAEVAVHELLFGASYRF